ncbi:MAG: hypothetical protein RBR65_04675 [Aliarcobacter sp.]|jgi:hypothetical protein|nr:hypothetical protein [Aliarcobacter sp.]
MILKALTLILIFSISLFSCAGGWDYNQKEFIFLEHRKQPFSNISEDIKSPNVYNTIYWKYEEDNKKKNIQEWQKQLNNSFSDEQIEDFVYKRKNLDLIKDKEIQDYLLFVNAQENHVTDNYYMSVEDKKKLKDYNLLLKEAIAKIDTVNSSYLKLRYFYLALRLAHFKKQEPLVLYEKYKYLLDSKDNTIVKDWIQGLYAGALVKKEQVVQGVYEFTKLFDADKINWHLSYYNFHHIKTNEQWNELQKLAHNNDEKTKIYALRALNENSNVLEELQNIYTIDKNSKWFDFVLYRELLDTQHFFDQHSSIERIIPYKKYIDYLKTINKDDMYLVDLSLAYFNLYENNFIEASNIEKKLLNKYPNSHEVKTFSYILYLQKLEKIDKKDENIIFDKMQKLIKDEISSTSIHNYTFVVLEKLYLKQNDKFYAFLASNINYLNEASFDLKLLEKFKTFMEEPKQSKIQEHFAKRYLEQNMLKNENDKFILNDNLKKAKTKLLINNLKFEEALKLNSIYLLSLVQFNPFNGLIKGNNRSGKQDVLTIKSFLEKTILIKSELAKNPNSSMDNYLFANALYNLSYFGNANILTTVYRSVYSFNDKNLQKEKIDLAIKYYTKALENSKEKEFKAKITYMLAKAELALYDINYATKTTDYFNKELSRFELERYWFYNNKKVYNSYIKNNYGKYFDILKKDYNNTKYYKEIIKECANLRIYQKSK